MKIVCVDNFAREYIDDVLVCENINEYFGKSIVEFLNEKFSGEQSPDYFRLVEDDYELNRYEF